MICQIKVYILLGTYNGADFLHTQLNSIQQQTLQEWRLLIRDDGSEDDTLHILEDISREDARIEILKDEKGHLGVTENYNELMLASLQRGACIVCFADQDDVWLPTKVANHLTRLHKAQEIHGAHTPILVHSDLKVVDRDLNVLHGSLARYQGIYAQPKSPLRYLLAQNFVTGCASTINRALLEIATPLPRQAVIHDWWIALCAAACGQIEYIDEPTVLYRQHGHNQVGAIRASLNLLNSSLLRRWRKAQRNFSAAFGQATALKQRLGSQGHTPQHEVIELLEGYARLPQAGPLERLFFVQRSGIRRQGWFRQPVFWISLLAGTGILKPAGKT